MIDIIHISDTFMRMVYAGFNRGTASNHSYGG